MCMSSFFINHSNHPSQAWGNKQREEAERYGAIVDMPFPDINPQATIEEIKALAIENGEAILAKKPKAVLCQGEFTYTYQLVKFLQDHGVLALAACSKRQVQAWKEGEEEHKSVVFVFTQFRNYDI